MAVLETTSGFWRKARSVNQTSASFVSKVPTGTEPTGDAGTATGAAVIDLLGDAAPGAAVQNAVLFMPYAVGADNVTFSVRVFGWRLLGAAPLTSLWVPTLLGEFACVASAFVGVAARDVLNTERFADTITTTTAGTGDPPDVVSPTGDVAGHVLLDVKGFGRLEFTFAMLGGVPATSANALLALL